MLFGRRKPGYTTTVDGSVDPEQAVLELQKAELAAKKKPKAEVFDIDAASETARRLKETGSTFDGSAAKTGEDVIAAVERETAELAAKQAAEAAPEAAEAAQPDAAKPELLDFLAGEPEAENDPFADQPTKTAPELPELTPAQELAGYIRARSAAALLTPHALLLEEVENADELLAQMPADPQCTDIVTRAGAKDTYYYSNANMSEIIYPKNIYNRVTYTYGDAGETKYNRVGRLKLVEDGSGGQAYYYGKLGEVTKTIKSIILAETNIRTYIWEADYDSWNRVQNMTYPDGEVVSYSYDKGGNLQTIKTEKNGDKQTLIAEQRFDKYGNLTYRKMGNGTETKYDYDEKRLHLNTMSLTSNGVKMMENVYKYDNVDNILGISNAAAPTGNWRHI